MEYLIKCDGQTTDLDKQVMCCNPILEAFGNARTVMNNNTVQLEHSFVRLKQNAQQFKIR